MPRFKPVFVDIIDRHTIYLQWGIEGLDDYEADRWRIDVRTSFSEGGPWTFVQRGLPLTVYTLRHQRTRRDRWQIPFYQLDLLDGDNKVSTSELLYPRHPPDTRAEGIRRRLEQLLKGEHGVRISFLKKRLEGRVDVDAFDPVLHRPTGRRGGSHSHQYEQGFYAPIETWAKIGIDPRLLAVQANIPQAVTQTSCWLAGTPLVTPGDLVVEWHVNRRWRVGQQVERYARRQTLFRQLFGLEEIALGDPEYEIEVPRIHIDTKGASSNLMGGLSVVREAP